MPKDFYKKLYLNENKTYLFLFFVILLHLLTLNFYPTNFEGSNGVGANFFKVDDKLTFLQIFFRGQFNSFLFPFFGSLINEIFPFLNGNQSIRILSVLSYIFLLSAVLKIFKLIFQKEISFELLVIIFLNPILWHYGHRMYVGLFSYSLSLFAFACILSVKNKKYFIFLYLLLGVGIALKPFNLILLPVLTIIYAKKLKFVYEFFILNLKVFFFSLLIPISYYLLIYIKLGNFITPENEDLKIALFSGHDYRGYYYIFNNFINYIGYVNLILFPFSLMFFDKKNYFKKLNITFFILIVLLSYFLSQIILPTAELNFGPLQSFFSEIIFLYLISISFLFFIFFNYFNLLSLKNDYPKFEKYLLCLIFIILYILALSFIKGSQRYIIPIIPIYLILLNQFVKINLVYKLLIFVYFICNSALLLNYYIVGNSYNQIINFLEENNILYKTNPMVITPHVFHLYQNKKALMSGQSMYIEESLYFIDYGHNDKALFNSSINLLNFNINKYAVFKYD